MSLLHLEELGQSYNDQLVTHLSKFIYFKHLKARGLIKGTYINYQRYITDYNI